MVERPPAREPARPGRLPVHIERCDPLELATAVVESARGRTCRRPSTLAAEGTEEAAADRRRPRAAPAGAREPRRQRDQVLARGRAGRVELENGAAGVRFTVADEGLGIPASEHRRIFEKFYRLDPDMTRGIGGTGLGLYISRELVRRMDGRIWVESEARQGLDVRRRAPGRAQGLGGLRSAAACRSGGLRSTCPRGRARRDTRRSRSAPSRRRPSSAPAGGSTPWYSGVTRITVSSQSGIGREREEGRREQEHRQRSRG